MKHRKKTSVSLILWPTNNPAYHSALLNPAENVYPSTRTEESSCYSMMPSDQPSAMMWPLFNPGLLTIYNTQAYITLSWRRESCDIVPTRTGSYTAWYPIQKRPLCARLHWMAAGSWAVVPCNVNVTDATQHTRDVDPMLVCWVNVSWST